MLNVLWAAFLALAFVCGAMTGRLSEVSAALTEGAAGAVTLAIGIAGLMCFWSGIMELMQQSGLTHIIARFLMPVLRPLFGKASEDSEAMQAVSANVTANLLGLSNAATPLGLRAASRLHKLSGSDTASDAVLTLIVLNGSGQLCRPRRGSHARIVGNKHLYHRSICRTSRTQEDPLRNSGSIMRGFGSFYDVRSAR